MLGVILPIAAFYIFVSMFSEGAESQARWKIFTVALIATMLLSAISRGNPTMVGSLIACAVAGAVALAGLLFWIRLTRIQALKVTASYLGFVFAYAIIIGVIFGLFGVRAA